MTRNSLSTIAFRCSIFAVLTLWVFASIASGEPRAPVHQGNFRYCMAQGARTNVIYFTAVFETKDATKVNDAFAEFLKQKYSVLDTEDGVLCYPWPSLAIAQQSERGKIAELADYKKWKIVETGWKYGSAAAADTAPPQNAVNPPATAQNHPPPAPAQGQIANAPAAAQSTLSAQGATATGIPQAAAVPPAFVKIIDLVDSTRDPAGKVYRGGLVRPVNIGNGVIIAQGSPATVVLVRNGSGWNLQLTSLVIKGQVTPVRSEPGILTGAAAEKGVAAAANRANAILGRFGRKPSTYSPVAAVEMGRQVVLMPGLTLSFVLNPVPVPAPPTPVAAAVARAAQPLPSSTAAGQSAQSENQAQYVCILRYSLGIEPLFTVRLHFELPLRMVMR